MQITTRLLLPFTAGINAWALDFAVQLAAQYSSILVPLALVPLKPGKGPRLEAIQQAQDFLVLIQRKAERRGVPLESSQVYTQDVARSIEAFAGEMNCEVVLLFLSNASEVLLGSAEIQTLMERLSCNMHIVLLPEKRKRHGLRQPLYVSLLKHAGEEMPEVMAELSPVQEERVSFLWRIMHLGAR